jgi:hypothetical protein
MAPIKNPIRKLTIMDLTDTIIAPQTSLKEISPFDLRTTAPIWNIVQRSLLN